MSRSLVIMRVRRQFLDSDAVIRRMDAATRRALMRIGGYTRTTARRSLKVRSTSRPGQPPALRWSASPLKRLLFYSYDERTESVVIGPVGLGSSPVPSALEYGGVTPNRRRRGQNRRVRPRPFMRPAFTSAQSKIPDAFDGILNKTNRR